MRQMPSGSSKFNVQEFKVILRPVPAVPNVPPVKASRQFKVQCSTFNDHTPSDSFRFSGILLGMRHEETGKS
jgi:hypothetical protein